MLENSYKTQLIVLINKIFKETLHVSQLQLLCLKDKMV